MNDVKLPEYPSFYEVSGDINDINTLLVNKNALLAIHEQGRLAGLAEAASVIEAAGNLCRLEATKELAYWLAKDIRALAASDGGE